MFSLVCEVSDSHGADTRPRIRQMAHVEISRSKRGLLIPAMPCLVPPWKMQGRPVPHGRRGPMLLAATSFGGSARFAWPQGHGKA